MLGFDARCLLGGAHWVSGSLSGSRAVLGVSNSSKTGGKEALRHPWCDRGWAKQWEHSAWGDQAGSSKVCPVPVPLGMSPPSQWVSSSWEQEGAVCSNGCSPASSPIPQCLDGVVRTGKPPCEEHIPAQDLFAGAQRCPLAPSQAGWVLASWT